MLTLKEFLAKEVVPALGCTEPGAVALATARARQELGRQAVERVSVKVSDSVYKNGMNVGVPGAAGETGNLLAAAIGAVVGRAELGLEVLRDCTPSDVAVAKAMIADGRVELSCLPDVHGMYVEATVASKTHTAVCLMEQDHSTISSVVVDGATVYACDGPARKCTVDDAAPISEADARPDLLDGVDYETLLKLADDMDADDVEYVMRGVEMNRAIAEYGLTSESLSGLGMGKAIWGLMSEKKIQKDLAFIIRSYSSAASDARMAGAQLPAMSAAGSGNSGITAILPVALAGESMGKSREEIARAVTVSLLSTSFVRSRTGHLTPVCGCAVAAGAGAAAGIVTLGGGSWMQSARAMQIVLANTAGVVCDGAKGTCALRVGSAACEAYLAALIALDDGGGDLAQGIVDKTIEQTAVNVGRLNAEGMKDVDRVLIEILEARVKRGDML